MNCEDCAHEKVCEGYSNCEEVGLFEPKRPHGEWIPCSVEVTALDGQYYCYHKCSICGQKIESGFDKPPEYNFCPNCGADMREGEKND